MNERLIKESRQEAGGKRHSGRWKTEGRTAVGCFSPQRAWLCVGAVPGAWSGGQCTRPCGGGTCPASAVATEGPWWDLGPGERECALEACALLSACAWVWRVLRDGVDAQVQFAGFGAPQLCPPRRRLGRTVALTPYQSPQVSALVCVCCINGIPPWARFKVGLSYAVLCRWEFSPLSVLLRRDGTGASPALWALRGPLWGLGPGHPWRTLPATLVGAALRPGRLSTVTVTRQGTMDRSALPTCVVFKGMEGPGTTSRHVAVFRLRVPWLVGGVGTVFDGVAVSTCGCQVPTRENSCVSREPQTQHMASR